MIPAVSTNMKEWRMEPAFCALDCRKGFLCSSNKTPDPVVVKEASWRVSWVEEENLGLWVDITT